MTDFRLLLLMVAFSGVVLAAAVVGYRLGRSVVPTLDTINVECPKCQCPEMVSR